VSYIRHILPRGIRLADGGMLMVERFDALAQKEADRGSGSDSRRQEGNGPEADVRGLGSIMYRAASLRASRRALTQAQGQAIPDPLLGGVYLPPGLRRALAALLRGDHVSEAEKAALARAASLLSKEPLADEPARADTDPWAAFRQAANSNVSLAARVEQRQSVWAHAGSASGADNPILRGLGFQRRDTDET
jgi:hypothetical protein